MAGFFVPKTDKEPPVAIETTPPDYLDGGTAFSVFTTEQPIDGGSATTDSASNQLIDGGTV